MRIILIVGQPSSGKDTAAAYLVSKGFSYVSTGDIVREEMTKLGLTLDRPTMHDFCVSERAKQGLHWPANIACERVTDKTVMAGFRNMAEVEYVRKHFSETFHLVALTVPIEIRYERAKSRNRIGDNISFEKFVEQEKSERSSDSQSHELDKVIVSADTTISNDGTPQQLEAKIDTLLQDYGYLS